MSWHPNVPVIASTSFDGSVGIFGFSDAQGFKARNSRQKMTQVGYYGSGRIFEGTEEEDEDSFGNLSDSDYEPEEEDNDNEENAK